MTDAYELARFRELANVSHHLWMGADNLLALIDELEKERKLSRDLSSALQESIKDHELGHECVRVLTAQRDSARALLRELEPWVVGEENRARIAKELGE